MVLILDALPVIESQANTGIVDVADTLTRNLGLAGFDKLDKLNLVRMDGVFVDHDHKSLL